MSEVIQPKSTGKAPIKSIPATGSQAKKIKKRKVASAATGLQFRTTIKKLLKEGAPESSVKITEKTLRILCAIADSLMEDTIICASELAKKIDKETIGIEDIIASFELRLTGELRNLCVRELKALASKSSSKVAK